MEASGELTNKCSADISETVRDSHSFYWIGMWRSQPISTSVGDADFMCKICRIRMWICRAIKITSY